MLQLAMMAVVWPSADASAAATDDVYLLQPHEGVPDRRAADIVQPGVHQ